MKKYLSILLSCLFCLIEIQGQETITINLRNKPLTQLLEQINQQTHYKVYYSPTQTDSVYISMNAERETPIVILNNVLSSTSFKMTIVENTIYILKEKQLVTELPKGYFEKKHNQTQSYDLAGISLGRKKDQKATSENKVYEIGDINGVQKGEVTLSGVISDFKTGELLPGITLSIQNPVTGTTTNASGYYSMRLPVGRHELQIRGVGIEDTKRQIMIYADGKLDIELQEQVYALGEVSISSERFENVRSTTIGMERLKMTEVKNIPTVFGEKDILRIVMALPGVKSVGEVSSGFNVRGGATDQNLILFNEGVIYNPTHLFGLFSAFNPDIVDDMELYKSSIPAKYGGRISSVLDINTREGNKEKFTGSASLGLLTSRITLEGPLFNEKTSFLIGGRTTYSDWLLKQIPEDSEYKDGKAGFYDLNAHINHTFNERDNLSVNGYFSRDRFSFSPEEKYAYQNTNVSAKWRHIFSPLLMGFFTAGYDHYDHTTTNTENESQAYRYAFGVDQFFAKTDFSWAVNSQHTIDFGFQGLYYNLNPGKYLPEGNGSMVLPDRLQKEKALESAIYMADQWDITDKLSLNVGVRYSMLNVLGPREYNRYESGWLPSLNTLEETISENKGIIKTYHGPEFRFSVRYEFADEFSVKAGFNTMRQNIHKLSNTTLMAPTDTWKLSDVNIKPQTGSQVAIGLYKNFMRGILEASVESYYKRMNDYLDYRSNAQLIMNHHIETDVLNTEGRAYGIELMLRKPTGKLNGWISYSYSRTELRQSDPCIVEPVNRGDWYPSDYDKPHEFKFVGNYKLTHRFSFSMNCDYSTGRPITLPVAKYEYVDGEYVYYSDRNKYRIPDFFRMDASFNIEPSHRLTLLTHSKISIGVYNLTGRKNAYSVYYVSENGKMKGYQLSIFGVPIPYISYNIKF